MKLIGIGRHLAGQDVNFSQSLGQNWCASGYQRVHQSSGEVFQVPPNFEFLRRKQVLFHVGIVQNSIFFKKSPRYLENSINTLSSQCVGVGRCLHYIYTNEQ